MSQSTSAVMKYFYDDNTGTPQDITAIVLSINDIELKNMLQQVDPYGVLMKQFSPSGKGEMSVIEIGGLYKTDVGGPDTLFSGRIPEDPSAATRTFTAQWVTGTRAISIETHLDSFKRSPNKDNGLTRWTARLQPTGNVTETP